MNRAGPSSQRFRETHGQIRKRSRLTGSTHLGSTLCSPFHMKWLKKHSQAHGEKHIGDGAGSEAQIEMRNWSLLHERSVFLESHLSVRKWALREDNLDPPNSDPRTTSAATFQVRVFWSPASKPLSVRTGS